ncbi:PLETHORA 5, EMBRYOMAKER, CHOTTO 1, AINTEGUMENTA-like 5 [Hibiscus trionum]|uniref:PLETHORA 5, EMBRYOMAKER, CHOTTO 1, AINTEGUMENTA-like 5 n=1 Tax=Hibiscus trionum TaxID=183268 RepID=A0A9W7MS09_HIBTR|nr:PLETHORA 5, EMBRYOMAKER, CHOTTO 1, AINTEGUMENTA-like 5 [Hibiscus trionum]
MDMNTGNSNSTDSFSTQTWLAFSLSNFPSSSSNLCFFEAFNPSTTAAAAAGVPPTPVEEGAGAGTAAFNEGPRLEDFLGGSSTVPGPGTAAKKQHHFSSETVPDNEMYDSELKTIAASFLRGLSPENKQHQAVPTAEPAPRKAADSFGQRTSIYRGVTRHRWTGRYEAHLWDNSCRREGQSRKGRQGGYDKEDKAARAYDLAALKYWGPTTTTNFPISNYEKELEEMKNMSRQEFVASLRRKSSGFSRGASIYRGVTRHHQHGRWQARIGRVAGNKDLYLGTFSTQEEAAEAYDIAAIKFRGLNAVTNFDMCRYDVKSIASSNLPIGGLTGKSKSCSDSVTDDNRDLSSAAFAVTFASQSSAAIGSNMSGFAVPIKQDPSDYWSNIFGYNNSTTKSPSAAVAPSSMLQSPTRFGMDFGVNSANNESINNGDGYNVSTSIPLATPIVSNNSDINNYEDSTGYHSWNIAQPLHSYQTAKPSLSVLQTPIFGME